MVVGDLNARIGDCCFTVNDTSDDVFSGMWVEIVKVIDDRKIKLQIFSGKF